MHTQYNLHLFEQQYVSQHNNFSIASGSAPFNTHNRYCISEQLQPLGLIIAATCIHRFVGILFHEQLAGKSSGNNLMPTVAAFPVRSSPPLLPACLPILYSEWPELTRQILVLSFFNATGYFLSTLRRFSKAASPTPSPLLFRSVSLFYNNVNRGPQ